MCWRITDVHEFWAMIAWPFKFSYRPFMFVFNCNYLWKPLSHVMNYYGFIFATCRQNIRHWKTSVPTNCSYHGFVASQISYSLSYFDVKDWNKVVGTSSCKCFSTTIKTYRLHNWTILYVLSISIKVYLFHWSSFFEWIKQINRIIKCKGQSLRLAAVGAALRSPVNDVLVDVVAQARSSEDLERALRQAEATGAFAREEGWLTFIIPLFFSFWFLETEASFHGEDLSDQLRITQLNLKLT